jgi:hypothetical protein
MIIDMTDISNLQKDFLLDTCTIDTYSSASGLHYEKVEKWTSGSEINCGFLDTGGKKIYSQNPNITKQYYDVSFRISSDNNVTDKDKLTIAKIGGSSVTNHQYQIVDIKQGHGLWLIGCEDIEG